MSKCSIRVAALLGVLAISTSGAMAQTVWKFNNLSRIGGVVPKVEGAPQLVDSLWSVMMIVMACVLAPQGVV